MHVYTSFKVVMPIALESWVRIELILRYNLSTKFREFGEELRTLFYFCLYIPFID